MRAAPNDPWKNALLDGYATAGVIALAGYLLWVFAVSRKVDLSEPHAWRGRKAERERLRQDAPSYIIPADLLGMLRNIGPRLPELWNAKLLGDAQKKALLRSLIDKVVIHRLAPDQVQTRVAWRGGATTSVPRTSKLRLDATGNLTEAGNRRDTPSLVAGASAFERPQGGQWRHVARCSTTTERPGRRNSRPSARGRCLVRQESRPDWEGLYRRASVH